MDIGHQWSTHYAKQFWNKDYTKRKQPRQHKKVSYQLWYNGTGGFDQVPTYLFWTDHPERSRQLISILMLNELNFIRCKE